MAAGAALSAPWACGSSSSPVDTPDGSAAAAGGTAGTAGAGGSPADAAAPETSTDAASGVACATHDGGTASCLGTCGADELCFTQVACGPGGPCTIASGTDGDDKCHPVCGATKQCPAGLVCQSYLFFGCTDFNGFPAGKEICCPPGGCGN